MGPPSDLGRTLSFANGNELYPSGMNEGCHTVPSRGAKTPLRWQPLGQKLCLRFRPALFPKDWATSGATFLPVWVGEGMTHLDQPLTLESLRSGSPGRM